MSAVGGNFFVHLDLSNTAIVDVFSSLTGLFINSLRLDTVNEAPLHLQLLNNVLVIGYKRRVDVWNIKVDINAFSWIVFLLH